MEEDSPDELAEQSPGPNGHSRLSPAAVASDAESGSGGDEDDDSGSEDSVATEDEDGLEERWGSEEEEEEEEEDEQPAALGQLEPEAPSHSDDDAESCPICLNPFRDQALGTPENCLHYFCLDCIVEWAKNANSCPVDRTLFQHICIRAEFNGKVLKKVPVQSTVPQAEEDDPTFCEVCGRSDHEDRLLLCDGCDAGYHMECLDPPLQEVPVDEWFCPECGAPEAAAAEAGSVSEDEVSLLLADVVPTSSRLRPRPGRTRAIARTRQSERVRATVNRNRLSTARSIGHVPRDLMSSLLDETIEAVAAGLSTAVYQRPLTPRAPLKRRRKTGRRKKAQSKASGKSRGSRTRTKKRQGRTKRRGRPPKNEVTARSRIARTLGLRRPARGACLPAVHRPAEPSLGLMRADIGAASLSLFGDPYELDPFDSGEDQCPHAASPLGTKRTALSRSALRSHQPVARPLSMGISRTVPAVVPEPEVDAPVTDLLGSILSGQSLLMLGGDDVLIHRDGSLSAKRPAPVSFPQASAGPSRAGGPSRTGDPPSSGSKLQTWGSGPRDQPLPGLRPPLPVPTCIPTVKPNSSGTPGHHPQITPAVSRPSPKPKPREGPCAGGHGRQAPPFQAASSGASKCGSSCPPDRAARQPPTRVPRPDISLLPRIPKIKREEGSGQQGAMAPASGQHVGLPDSCISRLTGKEGPGQPGHGTRADGEPSSRGPQAPGAQASSSQSLAPRAPCRGKGSTFESFRINIPGNTAHAGRTASPGFCNTFRPVDSEVQRKEPPAPLFSIRKTKQLKSEIYDPFEPTGSDSTSPESSPEHLGAGLLPSEITRTISVGSPQAPAAHQAVRCVTSYTVQSSFGPGPPSPGSPGPAAPHTLWDDVDGPARSSFFGCEERTVTCVPDSEPDPPQTTHRVVELHTPAPARSSSRSRSRSSSRGRKPAKKQRAGPREHRGTRSRSGDRSSRSASPALDEEHSRRPPARARSRRSSSERSGSHERARRRKARARSKERKKGRRRTHSGSPGSPAHGSRRKRARARGGSSPSSLDRGRRHRHQRERSRDRLRERPGSRERRKRRSHSPSPEHRSREQRRPRSREKRPRARSPERKPVVTLTPPVQEQPMPDGEPPVGPTWPEADAALEGPRADGPPQDPPVPEAAAECPPEDLDYGDTVEAGHVFEDLMSDPALLQLDDMSSPPSPESSDSSPERPFLPAPPRAPASTPREGAPPPGDSTVPPPPRQDAAEPPTQSPAAPLGGPAVLPPEEPCAPPLLRARTLVKRVTWNLQEAGDSSLRTPVPQLQKPQEGIWDAGPPPAPQQAPFLEPPPPGPVFLEPGFPTASPSQVYNPSLPSAAASQPMVQFILQGGLPLASSVTAPSPAPAPTTALEAADHNANNSDEKAVPPRPASDKAKNEEYMKKLHTQERAVEEVKLAIKPFYQRREVTKDEYKDILRKAVQKICHSKSREINPVKVAHLVKAYVDKYRHMRKHRRPEAGEEPPAAGAQG